MLFSPIKHISGKDGGWRKRILDGMPHFGRDKEVSPETKGKNVGVKVERERGPELSYAQSGYCHRLLRISLIHPPV
jgi:hypothetical protein